MKGHGRSAIPIFGIYGTGGYAREVAPVADWMLREKQGAGSYELAFIDDTPSENEVNGHRVMTFTDFVASEAPSHSVSIAIADSRIRQKLDEKCGEHDIGFFSIIAPNAVIMDDVEMDEGAILSPFVTITSNVRIGRHFHANLYASVAHDCRIGDFVTLAPRVSCNGNTIVENHAYLGSGCQLRHGAPDSPLEIGKGAVVGMGAVVTKSVPPGVTVVGNPAKPLRAS